MSIFQEYAGPAGERGYYSQADWNKLNNTEWASSQAEYDAFAEQAAARAASRAAAMNRAREAIPYSYTNFGTESTTPTFSLAGFAGQSSGGTAGRAGTAGFKEGGVVQPVQYMQEGGIASLPFANSIKPQPIGGLGNIPQPDMSTGIVGPRIPANLEEVEAEILFEPLVTPDLQQGPGTMPGVGGLFEAQFVGSQGAPLSGYQKFLMDTYGQRAVKNIQENVGEDINEFVDLVRQAEQAHFGERPEMQTGPNFAGAMAQPMLMEAAVLPVPRGGERFKAEQAPLDLAGKMGQLSKMSF